MRSSLNVLSLYLACAIPVAALAVPKAAVADAYVGGGLVIDERPDDPREYLYWKYPKEAPVMDRIIDCESGWKTSAKNKTSSASGLAQFISGTWVSVRKQMGRNTDLELRFDPHENIDSAVWLYRKSGLGPWECKSMI